MIRRQYVSVPASTTAAIGRLAEAAHLQAIKGNPPAAEEIAMFEMFERGDGRPTGVASPSSAGLGTGAALPTR